MTERLLLEAAGQPAAELPRAGTLVVGSDGERAGFVVPGSGVEGVHCAIGRAKTGGWAVKDLGSRAGTFVNGARVEVARIAAGDELRLGDVVLRVCDPAAGRPLQEAPAASAAGSPAGAAAKAATNAPAAGGASAALPVLSGYRIEKRIGRGGMGDVYLAVQSSLDRRVALKTLNARFAADAEFVRRFQAEARAAAALNHPNVVTVYDVGEAEGTHFLSMEFMERGTLEDRVAKAGRLSVDEVLAILRDAAAGLVFAEGKGIVHRDLKPANLMQNHVGQTKIADLGLATHVEAEEAQTADRKVFGTPHFMSPEQARGEKVDHRSDLYSLGATAYRLLTGHTPFEGKDAREIVRALLRDEPRPMRDFVPELPEGVVQLVARLMHKDVAQRIQSASELARELDALRARGGRAAEPAGGARRRSSAPLLILALAGAAAVWWHFDGSARFAPEAPGSPASPLARTPAQGTTARVAETRVEPAEAVPGPAAPDKPREKDDREIQLFEATAKVALLELRQRELSPNARRDELRLLAGKYQGTTAAAEAAEEAERISAALDEAAQQQSARALLAADVLRQLEAAAALDQEPPSPGRSYLAMRAVPVSDEIAADAGFVAKRKELESRVSGLAAYYAREVMGESNRALERGDYDRAKQLLADLLPMFDLPEFPIGSAPSGVDDLFDVGRRARERYFNLEQARNTFERARARADQAAVAEVLGGTGGFERELMALDLEAARARLEALAERVSAPVEKERARSFAAELAAARIAFAAVGNEFGSWRRRAFQDPRDRRTTQRTAVGADADGILYESEPGKVERAPWSAFAGDVQALQRLFADRLAREWTPVELAGIAVVFRTTAAVEAVRAASKMFEPGRRSNFTEGNARDVRANFAPGAAWAELAGPESKERFMRESAAADVLCDALRAATDARWAAAAAGLERLLSEFSDTLLVRLLSDGRSLQELSGG